MSFYVNILTNPARTVLYTGITNNLERRLHEHSTGLGESGKFTGRYQCNLLVYFEISPDAKQAIAREKQIKNWGRAKKDFLINTMNPAWEPIDLQTWSG
ncbi:GIY-YIG nuclease family protein [Hymenobacter humi]|uniref:GIY-YIG nuclease family protein n=1 Tax=Hymenobacter humi TaxID=1411620 RepID=A0ABW2U7M2_9BACT